MKMVGLSKISNGAATGSEEEGAAESSSVLAEWGRHRRFWWMLDLVVGRGEG